MSYVLGLGATSYSSATMAARERARAEAVERAKKAATSAAKARAAEQAQMKAPGSATPSPDISLGGGPPWGLILGGAGLALVGIVILKRRKKA